MLICVVLLWLNDPGCIYGCTFEDVIHFILECCLYNETSKDLKLRLGFGLNNLLKFFFLAMSLTDMHNLQMSKSAQLT